MSARESAITWMEAIAKDNSHGYDQRKRWGENGDYDCSAAVITAWINAGVNVKAKGATYTGNMLKAFLAAGFQDVTSSVNLAAGAGLQRGDVLLHVGHHTAMYCGNGKEVEASINEKGTVTGGKPGDQTGKEFLIRNYRNHPWDHVLRYPEANQNGGNASIDELAQAVIAGKYGSGAARKQALGANYDAVQARVNEILNAKKPAQPAVNIDALAHDVIAGKYGSGEARKNALGANYDAVQARVNEILNAKKPAPQTMVVAVNRGLWLRKGPSTNDEKIKAFPYGTKVEKIGETNGWAHVKVNGMEGYMSMEYLARA